MNNKKIVNNLILFFFSFIFLVFIQLLFSGQRLDYYWNYNNSLQISKGLIPYNDINILTTPLFHFIMAFFLKVFGKNIIVYAITISLFKIIHFIVLSKIVLLLCDKYKIKNKRKYFLFTFFTGLLLIYNIYYEYNFLSLLFLSIITYIELLNKKEKKYDIYIGILAVCSILSKQSIGSFTILFVLLKPLLFKENNKKILYRFLGMVIPSIIFIAYLLITNSFESFLNYAVYGLFTFNNSVSFFEAISNEQTLHSVRSYIAIGLLLYGIIFLFRQFYLLLRKKYDNNEKILLFYSIISISCFFPLRDIHHLLPPLLTFIPLFILSIFKYDKTLEKILCGKVIVRTLIIFGIFASFVPMNMYIKIYNNKDENNIVLKDKYNFINGMVVDIELKSNIDDIMKYEEDMEKDGNKVLILNKGAVLFHLARGVYHKDYDLFMRGNLGYNGEERLIDEIETSKNTIYLLNLMDMKKNTSNLIQLPDKVFYYVYDNLKENNQILYYTIYTK